MAQPSPQVNPERIWQIMTGFQHSAAFKAAVEIELFTKIGEGNKTSDALGTACGAAERGVRILADSLTVLGLLNKTGDEYSLTEVSAAFLDKHSPMYLGSIVEFIMSPQQRRGFDDLTGAVRRGGSAITGEASLDPDSPMWVTFARAMVPMMMQPAQMMTGHVGFEPDRELRVLDVAAGHGIFGIMVAKAFPNAQIYALDWQNVLAVATENAEKFGVADRHHLMPGSAFDTDFGEGYDVVLVTNFLHHFDTGTCTTFMRRVNHSLKPDGKALTLEFVPNDDRISPPMEALFSMIMLAATPAGDAYTFAELRQMFEAAGFSRNEHIPLVPLPQHLIVSQK